VKQKSNRNIPETVLIAINRNGFHIIDAVKKDILKSYSYSDLNFWGSGNTYFHMTFGNMFGASKFLCETTQGYKMDDLISCYIIYLRSNASDD
jgi:myosin-7